MEQKKNSRQLKSQAQHSPSEPRQVSYTGPLYSCFYIVGIKSKGNIRSIPSRVPGTWTGALDNTAVIITVKIQCLAQKWKPRDSAAQVLRWEAWQSLTHNNHGINSYRINKWSGWLNNNDSCPLWGTYYAATCCSLHDVCTEADADHLSSLLNRPLWSSHHYVSHTTHAETGTGRWVTLLRDGSEIWSQISRVLCRPEDRKKP